MKNIIVLVALFCCAINAFGQDADTASEKKKGFQKDKLFVGGSFGLTFGDYTLINVSPQVGYRFNKFLAAGLGTNFQYISVKERDYYNNLVRRTSQGVVGLNLFGRVYPIEQVMLQLQPEANYIFGKQKYYQPDAEYKMDAVIVPSLLAGGGLVLPAGRAFMIMSLMYDVLQNERSPYGRQPIVNVTFNVGL